MVKLCIACGMPMNNSSDFAMEDEEKDYCCHCTRSDGTMQSYNEKLQSLTELIVKTQGLDTGVAAVSAKALMFRLPAWKNYKDILN